VPGEDPHRRAAHGAAGLDVGLAGDRLRRAAGEPEQRRGEHGADDEHDVAEAGPDDLDDGQRHDQRRQAKQRVGHPAEHRVDRTAEEAGEQAERDAGDRGDQQRLQNLRSSSRPLCELVR
jgi:hypothetical protein